MEKFMKKNMQYLGEQSFGIQNSSIGNKQKYTHNLSNNQRTLKVAAFASLPLCALLLTGCADPNSSGSVAGDLANNTSANTSAFSPADMESPPPETTDQPDIDRNQTSFFFSYDESASTASRDLALRALANGQRPDPNLGRAYEFLNAENLSTSTNIDIGPFTMAMGLLRSNNSTFPIDGELEGDVYGLGVNLVGPTETKQERQNVVLTVLLDISGSMDAPYANETGGSVNSLLDVAKVGLGSMQESLKDGDVINLVTFGTTASTVLEGHTPTPNSLDETLASIFTNGSTDINSGLIKAYEVANRTFDSEKANRVVIVTDAFVNTGVIDPEIIAEQTVRNGLEGIYFSGIGVGASFNDQVLNTMTDIGKGSYSAMITPNDANRIFTSGFSRFLDPAVRDVRFQLTYPQELDQLQSFAEEISTVESDVQTINFSFNNQQFFLELFSGPSQLSDDLQIKLDVTYKSESGEPQSASYSQKANELLGQGTLEIQAAAAVTTLAQLINGKVTCDTVLSSDLYNTPVEHPVYTDYRQHIETYCSL